MKQNTKKRREVLSLPPEALLKLKRAFLSAQRTRLSVTAACKAANVPLGLVERWKEEDEKFAEAAARALSFAVDTLEEEARKRAVEGWEEPIIYKGDITYKRDPVSHELLLDENFKPMPDTVLKKSDHLLEVLLQAKKADYRKGSVSVSVDQPGGAGSPIPKKVTIEFVESDGNGKPKTEETKPAPETPAENVEEVTGVDAKEQTAENS